MTEAALTGESVPSEKEATAEVDLKAPLGDRHNMVFSGCSVTYGTATAVVTATGMDTEMGKIANLLDGEEEGQTPLQQKLAQLGKYLGIVALGACAIIFMVGLINNLDPLHMFMTAVSLAVSAIPEGLPAIVTIVLSIGVQRMVKKNALIRRLPAVETLGGASVICSDKTGTLTQNRMTLTKAYVDGAADVEAINNANSDAIKNLLMYGTLCCDGSVVFHGTEEQHIGDPTETAIVLAAHKNGMPKDDLNKKYPRLAEIPFDSDRKLMSTVNLVDGKNIVIVKGAFDVMMSRCIAGDLAAAKKFTESMSEDALRVLAVAYKEIDQIPENPPPDELERDLIFMGLVGMIDPPRPEAKVAVATCREAGIKPVMITGDHVVTASAIAKELGILLDGDKAITQLHGPLFVTYTGQNHEAKEKNREYLKTIPNSYCNETDVIQSNSYTYIFEECRLLFPILLAVLIMTVVGSMSVNALMAKHRLRAFAVFYICGLKWRECAKISLISSFMIGALSFAIAVGSIGILQNTTLLANSVIRIGWVQIVVLLGIMLIYMLFAIALPIRLIRSRTPIQVLHSN